jgi:perosamine synthetase
MDTKARMGGRVVGNELSYVREVLETDFRSSMGSTMMRRLETAFANRFGTQFAISFVNGTATLHAALEAWGIGPGDEVIVPPLTMSAPAFAVLQTNATPVFADVDKDTFQISAASIAERITSRTKAIMPVALYGLCPDMDAIMEIARNHRLKVIEDNAQCFLGTYKGRMVGTLGDCASFSFQSS